AVENIFLSPPHKTTGSVSLCSLSSASVLPPSLPLKIYYSHPVLFASFALICSSPANYPPWFIGKLMYLLILSSDLTYIKKGGKLKNIDKTDINKHIRRVLTKLQTHTQIQRRA
ncbi:unnamed protein product, partial [Brassica oleracea var. botrytis]